METLPWLPRLPVLHSVPPRGHHGQTNSRRQIQKDPRQHPPAPHGTRSGTIRHGGFVPKRTPTDGRHASKLTQPSLSNGKKRFAPNLVDVRPAVTCPRGVLSHVPATCCHMSPGDTKSARKGCANTKASHVPVVSCHMLRVAPSLVQFLGSPGAPCFDLAFSATSRTSATRCPRNGCHPVSGECDLRKPFPRGSPKCGRRVEASPNAVTSRSKSCN